MRQSYEIILRDADPSHPSPPHRRLARVLKGFLRAHGFVCTSAREVPAPKATQDAPTSGGVSANHESKLVLQRSGERRGPFLRGTPSAAAKGIFCRLPRAGRPKAEGLSDMATIS